MSRPYSVRAGLLIAVAVLSIAPLGALANAGGAEPIQIKLLKGHFEPQTLTVPAGQPLVLSVSNVTDKTAEFESFKLNREKVVEPGQTITVRVGPLSPGSYDFYDDFNQSVPQGSIVAR